VLLVAAWLTACSAGGEGANSGSPSARSSFVVGGSVSGLSGTLALHDDGGGDLTVTSDGRFAFAVAMPNASAYRVTVARQPAGQTCVVADGAGTIASADVTNVTVTCSATPAPPPSVGSGSLDPDFGTDGKVTTDFSGAPPPVTASHMAGGS
ncbi:MAG: hypothetical protein ACREXP_15325, partial [Steroidobacteraceae bacterium]